MCNTLVQENVGLYNGNGLEVCNLWYAYVPMMIYCPGGRSLQVNKGEK